MGKLRGYWFLYAGALAILYCLVLFASGGGAAVAAAPKTSCVTNKCHSGMGTAKFVHGPAAEGDCTFCHQKTGKHKFKPMPSDISSLCYQCHDKMDTAKHVHPPVKAGECTACHSPHQSPYRYQLRKPVPGLCFKCHDQKMMAGSYKHGPAAAGQCTVCHNPHGSPYPKMLFAKGNNVCFSCHTDKAALIKSAKHVHPAVLKLGCVACHSPHSAGYKYNLRADGKKALCLTCHKNKATWITSVKNKHGALETGKMCLNCHDPHGTDNPKMLRKAPMDLCLSCHNKKYTLPGGGKLKNMKKFLAKNKDWHGPIREKDCTACHDPHGSNYYRMLRAYFPNTLYSPYDPKNYALCFMCHQNTIASVKRTTTLTNFRNGNLNLHYVHVHQQKGRVCIFCHSPHGSNNPKHIRNWQQFGAWHLPTNFKKTATGGQCSPGCHQKLHYDRVHPVKEPWFN